MNVLNITNDISGYFENIGGATMFHTSPYDARKSMIVGHNSLGFMANLVQWCVNNVCDLNMHKVKVLNVTANECVPK